MPNWHHYWHQNGGYMGTLTVVQRFGSGLNLNVHFHTLQKSEGCALSVGACRRCPGSRHRPRD